MRVNQIQYRHDRLAGLIQRQSGGVLPRLTAVHGGGTPKGIIRCRFGVDVISWYVSSHRMTH